MDCGNYGPGILLKLLFILILVTSAAQAAFPIDCSYQCSANDLEVTGAQISDQNGNDLPCSFCEPGNPVSTYLTLMISNHASAPRYNLYVIYTLSVNGVNQPRNYACAGSSINGGQTIKAEIPISWICGQTVEIKNIILTWSSLASENTCAIVKNCHPPGQSWCTSLLSVKTPLVTAFTSNSPQCICVLQNCHPIQFTDLTRGGSGNYTYNWSFGDGTTSSQKDPTKQYTAPGIYQVTLAVSDAKCSDSHTGQVAVHPAPSASFKSAAGICLGSGLQFTDASLPGIAAGISQASIVKWEWDFGDGSAHSMDQNPVHNYINPGSYDVTLVVTDSRGCSGSFKSRVQVYSNPVPTFTVNNLCFNPTLSTSFQASGTYGSYHWDFGDGNISYQKNTTHFYHDQGTYNVKLTVTDINGCTGTMTSQVTIKDCDSPTIDGVTVFSNPVCSNLEVEVMAHVTDYVGVSSVILNYQVNGGAAMQKEMTFVKDSGSIKDGLWAVEIPGQPAGSTVIYWITAADGTTAPTESDHYSVSFVDCSPPVIASIIESSSTPCAGTDVLITVQAAAGTGVASVTIKYGGNSYTMSGPDGSGSGNWSYTVSGSGRVAGDTVMFNITATDSLNHSVTSDDYLITWRDCTAPVIMSIDASSTAPCAGTDVLVTVHATANAAVASMTIEYGGNSYIMSGPDGSISGDWSYTISGSGRSAGERVEYTITATDSLGNSVTSDVYGITWWDCTAPVILSITPSSTAPCAGTDVLITVHATANEGLVASVTIGYGANNYTMSGPDGSSSGDWSYTISGSGRSAGDAFEYSVTATDSSGNSVTSPINSITWRDCTAPEILSTTPSSTAPCANESVAVIAHIEDDNVVSSVSLVIDNLPYNMSPGPNAGNYSYLIPGRADGEAISYYVYAKDGYGNEATSSTFTLSWNYCPNIGEISPGDNLTCEGNDLEITAKIEPSVDIVSARIAYEEVGVAGLYQLEMTRTGDPDIWSGMVSGRRVRTINYSVIASTERNSVSSEWHNITWQECDEPEIIDSGTNISSPCAGADAQVSFKIRDEDRDFYLATITYEGKEYPLVLQGADPYPAEGIWNGSIPGAGRQAGEALDIFVKGYTLDTLGPNPPQGLGWFNVEWNDCSPSISEVSPGSREVCTGINQVVSARAISPIGISSMTLHYNDSSGPYEMSMVMDQGGSSTNATWTASVPYRPDGTDMEYYIVARSSNSATARIPQEGSYHMYWITCYKISVAKAAHPTNCSQGAAVTFALNVSNIGRNPLPHVSVEDVLPYGMSYVSSSTGGTNDGGQIVRWADIGALEAGESMELQVVARIEGPISGNETLTNLANVNAMTDLIGNITATDTAEVQAEESRISAIKTADPIIGAPGTKIAFTLEISNFGSALLPHVFVSDLLPEGMSYVSSTGGGVYDGRYINWSNIGPLAPGSSINLMIDAYVDGKVAGALDNIVDVTAKPRYGYNVTAQDTESVTAYLKTDFVVTKTALKESAQTGDNVTFLINVTNTGDLALNAVRVVDLLPIGLVYISDNSTPPGIVSGNLITWNNVGPLAAGETKFIELMAKVVL